MATKLLMFTFVRIFYICALCFGCTDAYSSPVLLWSPSPGHIPAMRPTLRPIIGLELTAELRPHLRHRMIVVFLEPDLTTRDFQCLKKQTGESCYENLLGLPTKTYYHNVIDPAPAMYFMTDKNHNNLTTVWNTTVEAPKTIACQKGTIQFVRFLHDPLKPRSVQLQKHDTLISLIMTRISCPTTYLYMAANVRASVQRRRLSRLRRAKKETPGQYYHDPFFTIYFKTIEVIEGDTTTAIKVDGMQVQRLDDRLQVTLTNANTTTIEFDVYKKGGYYTIKHFKHSNISYMSLGVEMPEKFSYHCGILELVKEKVGLRWTRLQFQVYPIGTNNTRTLKDGTRTKFYTSWDCQGFITIGILSGLMAMVMFIAIISCGICWLIDVRSTDRFDDPNGKTITVVAD